jgi:hypothetical protein
VALIPLNCLSWVPSSSETENRARAFSFLNTRSDFLTVAVVPGLLATASATLGDLAFSDLVTARPTHGDDVLENFRRLERPTEKLWMPGHSPV